MSTSHQSPVKTEAGVSASARQRVSVWRAGLLALWCSGALALPGFADDLSPYSKALAAYHDRRLEDALRYAQEAVRRESDHADAYFLLGELYYLRQDLTKAEESWGRAAALAPSRPEIQERLKKVQEEARLENGLSRSDTWPFVVRFDEGQTPFDLDDLQLLLRDTYRLVGQSFDYFPDHPITVILYPKETFDQIKGLEHRVGGVYDGKIRLPVRLGEQREEELRRVLWHEYTHALIHDLSKGQCPTWLHEGIAVLQESRIRPPDLDAARQAMEERTLVPWSQLWREKEYHPETLKLRYQQSYLIADYLVQTGGWPRIVSLLKRLGRGIPIEDALKAEYRREPAALERDWQAWLHRELLLTSS